MKYKELINTLNNISILLEIKGENPFKSAAYAKAAESITNNDINIHQAVKDNTLGNIKGFGKALINKITDYIENGKMEYYENLTSEIPETLIELTKISNLGSKKVRLIWKELEITNIDELENACNNGSLLKVKGFAEKTIEMIINSIEHKKASKGRHLQNAIKIEANSILKFLKSLRSVSKAEITGDTRRFTETITALQFIISLNHDIDLKDKILNSNLRLSEEKEGSGNSGNLLKFRTEFNAPLIIQIVPENNFALSLHNTTGANEYLIEFQKLAIEKSIDFENQIIHSENDLYKQLNIQFAPPELRESANALKAAVENKIPDLIKPSDLKGIIHVHSTWTDGHNSIKEMAVKSKELGFSYMVLSDHSRSAAYANGLSEDRVREQQMEIDNLNQMDIGVKIIKGIESDILSDGSLDYPENILQSFEFIIASIHSGFKMSKADMTKRIINALKNPCTNMLGHPTGRLLLVRPGYDIDIKQIIDCASDYGKAIENNCNPYRLDLSWENVIYAKEKKVKIAISPDSHRTSSLEDVWIGVDVARKGWLAKEDVINCLNYNDFMKFAAK